jgi:glycosyltransferase involved in cell wall biosynthesis
LRSPTGIQRVTERILGTPAVEQDSRIVFVARVPGAETLFEVDRQTIVRLARGLELDATIARVRRIYADMLGTVSARAVLPKQLPYLAMGRLHLSWLSETRIRGAKRRYNGPHPVEDLAKEDVYVNLGDFWCHHDQASAIVRLKTLHGIGVVQMIHDLFPVHHPQWDHPRFGALFVEQLALLAPCVDRWLVNSRFVRDDLERYLDETGAAAGKVDTIRLGWEMPAASDRPAAGQDDLSLRRLGLCAGGYFMQVGTVEPRKNHVLVLRALGVLRQRRGGPMATCLFVGRDGWKSRDFQRELERYAADGGAVLWLKDVDDHDLAALYRGALFTVFPSHREGWGLPVQESLSYGVPCIASNGGAIPEAGGDLVTYFDPTDQHQLANCLDVYLSDPGTLAEARARIARALDGKAHLATWSGTAQSVIDAVESCSR